MLVSVCLLIAIGQEETEEAKLASGFTGSNESDKPKTRKEIREERLKKEQQMVGVSHIFMIKIV